MIDGAILMVTLRVSISEIAPSGFAYSVSPLIAKLLLGPGR